MGCNDNILNKKIDEYLALKILDNIIIINKLFSKDSLEKILNQYIKPIDVFFDKIICLQQEKKIGVINNINIYFLHSCFQQNHVTLMIEAYQKDYLLDKETVAIKYEIEELSEMIKSVQLDFENYMKEDVIQIKYYEMHYFKLGYAKIVFELIKLVYMYWAYIIFNLKSYKRIKKTDSCFLAIGEYGCVCEKLYATESLKLIKELVLERD